MSAPAAALNKVRPHHPTQRSGQTPVVDFYTAWNHCGIGAAQMPFTVDRSPHKQGLLLPGAHIPILAPDAVFQSQPDFLFILPWNLSEEIMHQMAAIHAWGGRFVVPIPQLVVL